MVFVNEKQGIYIDKEGNWFYNDLPIINKAIYRFFNRHIEKDEQGGYLLKIGNETCKLVVEDTPYVVVGVSFVDSDPVKGEYFKIRLNDETEEDLDLSTFCIGKDNVPYCRIKKNIFPARFLRTPYYQLAEQILQDGEDRFYFFLNNQEIYIDVTV